MIKEIIFFFLDLLFTKKCIICGEVECEIICSKCFKKIKAREQEYSISDKDHYNGIMIAGDLNDEILEKLIKKFKYNFNVKTGQILGLFLLNFFKEKINPNPILNKEEVFNKENSIIVPVPTTKRRERWRGFNQSYVLASFLSKKTKIPIFTGIIKTKETKSQTKLKKEERKNNLKNCFKIIESEKIIKNKKIIIIDDVITTGSTINELSKEIKKYEPLEIWGLVLAHK
jgi:competence protein ComFC